MSYNESIAVITTYQVHCKNWKDPEQMGLGNYVYHHLEEKGGDTNESSTLASTRRYLMGIMLPVGKHYVFVDVCDILDSCVTVSLGSVVTGMPSAEQFDSINLEKLMQQFSDSGDQASLAMLMKSYNSILKKSNATSLSSDQTSGLSEEELQARLDKLSDISSIQIEHLRNLGPASSLAQINMIMETLCSALDGALQSETAYYSLDLRTRDNALHILQTMRESLSSVTVAAPSEMKPFLKNTLCCMTSMMTSGNAVLKNGDRIPLKDKIYAAFMSDDTDAEDDLDLEPPTGEELVIKNVLKASRKNFKSQVRILSIILQDITLETSGKMVKGEITSTKIEAGASILMAILGEDSVTNGVTISSPMKQRAKSSFPNNFCPTKVGNPFSSCKGEFGVTVAVFPCIPHYYPDSAKFLSYESSVLSAEITVENKIVAIRDLTDLILFEIPRKPETLPDPIAVNVTEHMNKHIPLVYHYFNISMPMGAFTFEIRPSFLSEQLIILIGHRRYPTPEDYSSFHNVSLLPDNNGTRVLFMNSKENNNRTGKFVAAVGLLRSNASAGNITREDLEDTFDADYTFRIFVSACYYFDKAADAWSGSHMHVVKAGHFSSTCASTHLTNFGTGIVPTNNEVEFDFFIANMGFSDNTTVYTAIMVFLVVYLMTIIWASKKDKKDEEKRGVIPLPDNNIENRYMYEISCFTGPDNEASCESDIWFMVSGDFGETPVREFPQSEGELYRRYERNTFVMTTPMPLGHLRYLRVYHNNYGRPPYDSWQLERVVIRDLQERKIYLFETNSWLALNRDDGLIDRTFACTETNEDEQDFSLGLYYKANRAANQDHMWMSIFLRPVGSRFSRKARVTVAAVFLFLSMLMSAFWYELSQETAIDSFVAIGPVPITTHLFVTGFFVLIAVYPLTLILTMIFKRARPRNLKRCRALDAVEDQKMDNLILNGYDEDVAEEKSKVPQEDVPEIRSKDSPAVRCLPWWTRPITWLLCFCIIVASILMVAYLAILWGNNKSTQWFASFFSSFIISIIIIQWINVGMNAVCSQYFTKFQSVTEDIDCDEELPHLKADEEWKNVKALDIQDIRKVHKVKGVDYGKKRVTDLKDEMQKTRSMKFVLRGIMVYCVFLLAVFILVNERTDFNAFIMQEHLYHTFIKPDNTFLGVKSVSN